MIRWIIFAFFAIVIGLYPLLYFIIDMSQGFLSSKSEELLNNTIWRTAFYQHILFGGLSLLTGWTQFSKKIRALNLTLHRTLGKIYLIAVLLSGSAGLYLAFFATGGTIASLGFGGLAVSWLITTAMAYYSIRNKNIDRHEEWMIRSYALAFAAVTLRIYLPLFQIVLALEFITAYLIISWACWVPNLVVAEIVIRRK